MIGLSHVCIYLPLIGKSHREFENNVPRESGTLSGYTEPRASLAPQANSFPAMGMDVSDSVGVKLQLSKMLKNQADI